MLKNTFCHLPGIGANTEQKLWDAGLCTWEDILDTPQSLPKRGADTLRRGAEESLHRLDAGDALWFAADLPAAMQWRLFADFRFRVAYLDIETTGLAWPAAHSTTIALHDGQQVHTYVHGRNMADFVDHVQEYALLVTFNGKCFDLPFLERDLGVRFAAAHIDLRYVLRALGFSGGLKHIEREFGLDRGNLAGVDGYAAVLLWNLFRRTRDERVLETLLAYNAEDVILLETLMHHAYNHCLSKTPFGESGRLTVPQRTANPFVVSANVLEALCSEYGSV